MFKKFVQKSLRFFFVAYEWIAQEEEEDEEGDGGGGGRG